MKTTGIIFIVLGVLNIIRAFMAASAGFAPTGGGLMFLTIGIFLICYSNSKKKKKQESDKWDDTVS